MFTNIVDFTPMTERVGDLRAHELLRAHNAIARQQIASEGGFEVEAQGAGFIIAFTSVQRAVR